MKNIKGGNVENQEGTTSGLIALSGLFQTTSNWLEITLLILSGRTTTLGDGRQISQNELQK